MSERDPYGQPRRRSVAWPLIGLLIAFALGIGLTFYAVRRWAPLARLVRPATVATTPAAPRLVLPSSSPAPAPTPPLEAVTALPDPETAERLAEVQSRLQMIEERATAASGDADRAEALLVAFATRRAIDRGQPLGYLEGMLRERFGGREAASVAMVIAASQRPITLVQLQDAFDSLSPALVAPRPGESWWGGMRRELGSLFVVRRAEQPSAIPDRTLARAERALGQGQVDVAAAEVARLPGARRAAAWLSSARRYVLAHAALDRLETAALLAPPADPTRPASSESDEPAPAGL